MTATELMVENQVMEWIDEWSGANTGLPIHEYLGITREEYAAWAENRASLLVQRADGTGPGVVRHLRPRQRG